MPLWTPKPMMRRVNWSITTKTQWVRRVADSHRNKSQLHKLVLRVTEKRKPGRTSRIRFWPVMNAQHTADNVFIDLHTKSQRDLLSNAGTTAAGIASFHRHDGLDEVSVGSLRARPTAVLRRKQHTVLSFAQHTMKMQ